jgi:serine/threonine protein phosphatase 1
MMWIRKYDVIPEKINHRPLIHGHTPISFQEMLTGLEKMPVSCRMNIDNGCVYSGRKGCGGLVALDLDAKVLHRVENCD